MARLEILLLALVAILSGTCQGHERPHHGASHDKLAKNYHQAGRRNVPNLQPLEAKRRLLAKRSYAHELVPGEPCRTCSLLSTSSADVLLLLASGRLLGRRVQAEPSGSAQISNRQESQSQAAEWPFYDLQRGICVHYNSYSPCSVEQH